MSEYKRLTERHENGYIELMCNSCKYNDKCDVETHYCNEAVKNCLAELEDKIENRTIIELPCKVGDTVYYETFINGISQGIKPHKVIGFALEAITQDIDGFGCTPVPIRDFGKDVFLTHKEAEARLKELQERKK